MAEFDSRSGVTRRHFLKGAGTLMLARVGLAQSPIGRRTLAYVGTYTGAPGSGGNGEGIYCFDVSESTGELSRRRLAAKSASPSWIVLHPSRKYLYAVNEVSDFQGNAGSVSAFRIDAASGDLAVLNVVSSEGAAPCYISTDALGKCAFVANYAGGSIAVLPILDDGRLGPASDVHRDSGSMGAVKAVNAPAGSFAVSGHDAPHAHMMAPAPEGHVILSTNLGQDRIYTYRLDLAAGKIAPADGSPFTALPSGDGPRHFAFHPNGHWLYSIQEEASNIAYFHFDAGSGAMQLQQTISTLPSGFAGSSFASEILIAPDGRFLYAANRLHDTIATLAIGVDGRLSWVGEASTMGDYPVQCRIVAGGRFLYACNRRSDSITCFRIDSDSGLLTFTGQYAGVGSPASIIFLELGRT